MALMARGPPAFIRDIRIIRGQAMLGCAFDCGMAALDASLAKPFWPF
jgi:hypothetical protein